MSRERLYRVIDNRVDEQMAQGLEHEAVSYTHLTLPTSDLV